MENESSFSWDTQMKAHFLTQVKLSHDAQSFKKIHVVF
jgi:hypothetical protein